MVNICIIIEEKVKHIYISGNNHFVKDNRILEYEGEYLYEKKWNGKGFDKKGNIIYEIINGNGKVCEYDINDNLIFKGEYLNGRRWNGLRKKYYSNGQLKFEIEYCNGNIGIKGKEYYTNGQLKFEGEYLDRKRNGKGRAYNSSGELKFEGEYLNGKRNGKGKQYVNGFLIFRGEFVDGKRKGKGIEYDEEGRILYEGEYFNNESHYLEEDVSIEEDEEDEYDKIPSKDEYLIKNKKNKRKKNKKINEI